MSVVGSESTQFQIGNSAWRARSTHGRNPIFKTPDDLRDACEQYFQWVEDNPMMTAESVKFQGVGKLMAVPKMRAMSIVGLCNFLDIHRSTWFDYREKPDFSDICERMETIIYQQKFEGAAADMLNASIIARDLGLDDKRNDDETDAPGEVVFQVAEPVGEVKTTNARPDPK